MPSHLVKTMTSSTNTESRGNYEKEWMFKVSVHRLLSTGELVQKWKHLEERIYMNTTVEKQVDLTLLQTRLSEDTSYLFRLRKYTHHLVKRKPLANSKEIIGIEFF